MKRQSKAEEALNKQIKAIDEKIKKLQYTVDAFREQIIGLQIARDMLFDEMSNQKTAREKASISRKP